MNKNYTKTYNERCYLQIYRTTSLDIYISRYLNQPSFLTSRVQAGKKTICTYSDLNELLCSIDTQKCFREDQIELLISLVHRRLKNSKPKIITMYKHTMDERFHQ